MLLSNLSSQTQDPDAFDVSSSDRAASTGSTPLTCLTNQSHTIDFARADLFPGDLSPLIDLNSR